MAPSELARVRRRKRRRHRPAVWWIPASITALVAACAVLAGQNSQWFYRVTVARQRQLESLLTVGVPSAAVRPLETELARHTRERWGPFPIAWAGPIASEAWFRTLSDQTGRLEALAVHLAYQKAAAAGIAWVQVAAPWHLASQATDGRALQAARTPQALDRLASGWTRARTGLQRTVAALSGTSGGLIDDRPRDVVLAAGQVNTMIEQPPADVNPAPGRQAVAAATRYLAAPPSVELSQHGAIMKTLEAAITALTPPDPFDGAVAAYLSTRVSQVSMALYNANTGATFLYGPNQTYDTASIVKATIMSTVLWQAQKTEQSLTAQDQQLMIPMIEDSSNSAATALWNIAGRSQGIQAFLNAAGMSSTAPGRGGYWGLTQTTALNQVTLLKLLAYPNNLLTPASQAYAANLMEHVVSWEAWGVTGGLPAGTVVALKNGWLPIGAAGWEINSIGHVEGDGQNYVLAILSHNNPSESYGITTLDTVSGLIWKALTNHPS